MKFLKKICFLLIVGSLFFIPMGVFALNEVNLYLFWGDGCPHCEKEMEYLKELKNRYTNLRIYKYETWNNPLNKEHLEKIRGLYANESKGVPFTVIGDDVVSGFNDSRRESIENLIRKYSLEDYEDKAGLYFNITHKTNLDGSLPPMQSSNDNNSTLEDENRGENLESDSKHLEDDTKTSIDERLIITLVLLILIIVLFFLYFITKERKRRL